jgi:hypothetical protein
LHGRQLLADGLNARASFTEGRPGVILAINPDFYIEVVICHDYFDKTYLGFGRAGRADDETSVLVAIADFIGTECRAGYKWPADTPVII